MASATRANPVPASVSLLDEEPLYEVENGQRVELPPMGAYETLLASELLGHLIAFCRRKKSGRAINEMLFDLATIGKQRRPDVAFVSYKRWPRTRRVLSTEAWAVTPDLAVEVVSPSNTAGRVLKKVREYFQAGVRLVWVIFPEAAEVHVYNATKSVQVLDRTDVLHGEPVLPGFRLALADLLDADVE